jgi:transcriptional regulator GlxA family with amidase domain
MPSIESIRVGIVAYEGVSLLDLSGPLEALRVASTHPNHLGASLIYESSVLSVHGGLVMTADGVGIVTEPVSAFDGRAIDTLIVPGACNVDDVCRDRELIDWVSPTGSRMPARLLDLRGHVPAR